MYQSSEKQPRSARGSAVPGTSSPTQEPPAVVPDIINEPLGSKGLEEEIFWDEQSEGVEVFLGYL